jgi:hypothetical protein
MGQQQQQIGLRTPQRRAAACLLLLALQLQPNGCAAARATPAHDAEAFIGWHGET